MGNLLESVAGAMLSLTPLGTKQRLSILIYHRVFAERDWMRPGEPTAAEFAWQMQVVSRHFNVLPLGEAVQKLRTGTLPPRAACVTFDDGYADNATVALPILQRYNIPATIFVASGYLDGGRMWNDTIIEFLRQFTGSALDLSRHNLPVYATDTAVLKRQAAYDIIRRCKYLPAGQREKIADDIGGAAGTLPDTLMMSSQQVITLHQQGIEIGGHTRSHPILASLEPEQAREEIVGGKQELEAITGASLKVFAYPNGRPDIDYKPEHVRLVREAGFEAAVATQWGVSSPHSDLFQLSRFTPWDKTSGRFLVRMAMNCRHVAVEAPGDEV